MKIVIRVFEDNEDTNYGTPMATASALSFERAFIELAALQRYIEERLKREQDTPIPF